MGDNSDRGCVRYNKPNSVYISTVSNGFFRKPKLSIEHSLTEELDTFAPARTFLDLNGRYTQNYLRIRVRNKGHSVAHNCRAQLRVIIPKSANLILYPSRDTKQLTWGRSADKSDISEQIDIHPIIGEGLCHVIFSDSRIMGIQNRYAFISILKRLRENEFSEEDGFATGNLVVYVIVSSDEAHCKCKFKIEVPGHFNAIRMCRLTRFESFKLRFFKIFPS
jgi:hypothetical protein